MGQSIDEHNDAVVSCLVVAVVVGIGLRVGIVNGMVVEGGVE